MIVIHYPTAFKALDNFIDQFNDRAEKYTQRLKTGAMATAKELVRIYGVSLLKANGVQEITTENLPTLQTNNHQLAKLVKCSVRTIQRHITRLQAAGIITRKIFHGSNANYELLIKPEILLVTEKLSVEKAEKALQNSLETARQNELQALNLTGMTSNCRHTYTCNTGKQNNNVIIPVDKFERRSFPLTTLSLAGDPAGNSAGNSAGNAGEVVTKKNEDQIFEKKIEHEAGEVVSRAAPSGHGNARPDAVRDNSLTLYADLLWMMARNLLYRNTALTERQVTTARRLIYKLYEPVSTEHLGKAHSQYVQRIALVDKYLRKDPAKRFVQLPYLYFDTTNKNGFVGTKRWFYDDQKRKQELQRELTVSRAIRSYLNNDKKEPAKRTPPLQLFRKCENTIVKFNDPALLRRFHAAVLQHENYQLVQVNN